MLFISLKNVTFYGCISLGLHVRRENRHICSDWALITRQFIDSEHGWGWKDGLEAC
ncbi:hypothetical protein V6Z11_D03G124900 [Gossypium hirsutum]